MRASSGTTLRLLHLCICANSGFCQPLPALRLSTQLKAFGVQMGGSGAILASAQPGAPLEHPESRGKTLTTLSPALERHRTASPSRGDAARPCAPACDCACGRARGRRQLPRRRHRERHGAGAPAPRSRQVSEMGWCGGCPQGFISVIFTARDFNHKWEEMSSGGRIRQRGAPRDTEVRRGRGALAGGCRRRQPSCGFPRPDSADQLVTAIRSLTPGLRRIRVPRAWTIRWPDAWEDAKVPGPRGLTFMMTMAIVAADTENMMAGSSMTTAAPTLVWKNPIAASQPLPGARESSVGAGTSAEQGPSILHT